MKKQQNAKSPFNSPPHTQKQQHQNKHDYKINQFFKNLSQKSLPSSPMHSPARRIQFPSSNTSSTLIARQIAGNIHQAIQSGWMNADLSSQFIRQAKDLIHKKSEDIGNRLNQVVENLNLVFQTRNEEEIKFLLELFQFDQRNSFGAELILKN